MSLTDHKSSSREAVTSDSADSLSKRPQPSSFTELSLGEEDSTLIPPNVNEQPLNESLLGVTEETQPCPIFTWKAETTDGIPIDASETYDLVPDQYKDIDSTIRAILEERDNEALWSVERKGERATVKNIPDSSRMQLFVQMERISIELIQLEESDKLAGKRASWALKQSVISSAVGILNAFVPVYYQDIHRYWVIKKFYGAVMKIAGEIVRHHMAGSPPHGPGI